MGLRIGELARRTGLRPATIRAWERRYDLLHPRRSAGGQRLYSDDDVDSLVRVLELVERGWAVHAAAARIAVDRRNLRPPKAGPAVEGGVRAPRDTPGIPNPSRMSAIPHDTIGPSGPPPGAAPSAIVTRSRVDNPAPVAAPAESNALLATCRAQRAILRAETPLDIVAALATFVTDLGGIVGPAAVQDDEVIPLDLSFGETDPLLARAEPYSVARFSLESLLPALVEDARRMVTRVRAQQRP